jgi:hypothetical protein
MEKMWKPKKGARNRPAKAALGSTANTPQSKRNEERQDWMPKNQKGVEDYKKRENQAVQMFEALGAR